MNPQKENGYTPIANEIMEALCKTRIPGEARQILDVILRKTYGWNKKEDLISLSQFVEMTGINRQNTCRAIKTLLDMNIIIKKDNGVIEKDNSIKLTYGFQKNYENWKPLSKKITLSKKIMNVIEKDNEPLSKKIHTKESIKTILKKEYIVPNGTPYQEIVNLYHEILPSLPQVVKLSDKRKTQLKARWYESEKTQCLSWWKEFFEMVKEIPFLMGENDRGWKADLEFLTRQEKFLKIIGGSYK